MVFLTFFLHLIPPCPTPKLKLNDFLVPEQSLDHGAENQVTDPPGKAL